MYHLGSCWNFGLSMSDIYNSGIEYKKLDLVSLKFLENYSEAKIDPKLNFGVAYYPEKFYYWFGKYWELDDRIVFAFDLTDLMNPAEPFVNTALKRSHIGAECKFGPFVVRADINSGYPTLGGGLISDIINIEYAFYGEERGVYTNQETVWFHRI
ncbi:hypothetical protein ATZ36_13560 [Candidatus Endomicrobiellum trichonymphae]|uniref:Uncharacterized protein n=1 Tax=Endomicrobium trichonymphae TaxID=1408204 RepID=A0A1E5IME1_ENDTX|nr:hypothetical protein ATZ36_13560 [Candidatus Endomicrobium trichonymphae]